MNSSKPWFILSITSLPQFVVDVLRRDCDVDIDVECARSLGLAVFNTPDVLTDSVAEIAMLHILCVLLSAAGGGACVVNIARGDLIDDDALIETLSAGHLGGAGLDVFRHEPRFDRRYLQFHNVFLTPHIGSSTEEARRRMAQTLCDGIAAWRSGQAAPNRVA